MQKLAHFYYRNEIAGNRLLGVIVKRIDEQLPVLNKSNYSDSILIICQMQEIYTLG